MSDISKKILSIDPDESDSESEAHLHPASEEAQKDTFPAFVHRSSPTFDSNAEEPKTGRWVIWIGILLALLWTGLSATYLYFQPLEGAGLFTPAGLTISGLVILFPALILLLFCVASYKLSRMSAKTARLSNISERLLQADQTSAHQATSLAEAIRVQMSRLDSEMSALTARFENTRQSAQAHSKTLNETSASLLSANETLEQSLKEQRTALESMLKTAEETFQQTEEKLDTQKNSLVETLDRTALSLDEAGQKLEDKSRAFDQFISESETRLTAMSEKLSQTQEQTDVLGKGLEIQISALTGKIAALQNENIRLSESLENRLPLLTSLTDSAQAAKDALFGVISKSIDATDALRSEANTVGELLSEKFQTLNDELSETKMSTQAIIEQAELSGQTNLERSQKALSELETRLDRLGKKSADMEVRHMTALNLQPETRLTPETPDTSALAPERAPLNPARERLHLHPLEEETSSQASGSKPYDLQIEPLDLESDMSIPSQNKENLVNPVSEPDVVKPLNDSTRLFGRSKPKEKSLWRWRDMMGGFDNPSQEEDPNLESTDKEAGTSQIETPSKSFETWIHQIGLNSDQLIDDGTLLEVANAVAKDSESISTVLWRRIPDVAGEISAAAQEYKGFPEAAHHHREQIADTINPEIMNRDALRNRLNTVDGKLYLLSWLV